MAIPAQTAPPPSTPLSERRRYLNRLASLRSERDSWIAHWQEINDYILPRRLRYLQTERNKGTKRNDKIINNTGTRAARILGAGKHAGETSPTRPWFRYDSGIVGDAQVQTFTADLEKLVYDTFSRSNLYSRIHELWFLQGTFSTSVLYVEEDSEDDVRGHVLPLGRYCLASTGKGRVDTLYDEPSMTVEQLVREFPRESISPRVLERFEKQDLDSWVDLLHVIEPNINRDTGKIDNLNMPYKSTWWEKDAPEDWDRPLRRSGYEEQPFVVARWDVIGEDIYGSGAPGMDVLGDVKALQLLEKRKAEAVDKIVRPPMKAPVAAKTQRLSLLPGDVSYVDETAQGAKFEAAIEVRPESVNAAEESVGAHERRILSTFFADLFQMMMLDPRTQPSTAREIDERHEEKMLMLGPVVERDNDEVLDLLHARVVGILGRRGRLPPVPAKLVGRRVKVYYTSIMAQAQKLLGTAASERFTSFVGSLSAAVPNVKLIPNWRKIVKNYADMLGMKPDEVNSDDVIDALEAAAAQEAKAKQMGAALATGADAAKAASQAELGGDSMLTRLLAGTGMAPPSSAYGAA